MKAAPNGPRFDPRRLSIEDLRDPARVDEALASWDELEPALLTAIETHPQHGPRLAMLRRADLWLREREARIEAGGNEILAQGPCPDAGELYDYARGPGYGPLSNARRTEIERHLVRCRECDRAIESLATPPPVPLDVASEAGSLAAQPGSAPYRGLPPPVKRPSSWTAGPRLRPLPRLVPLAIAASLVLALGLWIAILPSGSDVLAFPDAPLLRGSSGGPLYFPRERLLHPTPEAVAAFPCLRSEVVFELEPQADATSYRIDLSRHAGDPFVPRGESLARLTGPAPTLRATIELDPGTYTWSAGATVRGLERELGARDFVVAQDEDLCAELASLAPFPEPERSFAALRLLHERGYLADARAIARAMAPSAERDAYLGHVPGR